MTKAWILEPRGDSFRPRTFETREAVIEYSRANPGTFVEIEGEPGYFRAGVLQENPVTETV